MKTFQRFHRLGYGFVICLNKKQLKNVGPIRHCEPPQADVHNNNNDDNDNDNA